MDHKLPLLRQSASFDISIGGDNVDPDRDQDGLSEIAPTLHSSQATLHRGKDRRPAHLLLRDNY